MLTPLVVSYHYRIIGRRIITPFIKYWSVKLLSSGEPREPASDTVNPDTNQPSSIRIVGVSDVLADLRDIVKKDFLEKVAVQAKFKAQKKTQLSVILNYLKDTREVWAQDVFFQKKGALQGKDGNIVHFDGYEWLDPRVVKAKDLASRVETTEILRTMEIPNHRISLAMGARLKFWTKLVPLPELMRSLVGKMLVVSQQQTVEMKRLLYKINLLEQRISREKPHTEVYQQLIKLHDEYQSQVKSIFEIIKNSSDGRPSDLEVDNSFLTARSQHTQQTQAVLPKVVPSSTSLASIVERLYPRSPDGCHVPEEQHHVIEQEMRRAIRMHPFVRQANPPMRKSHRILDYLLSQGCTPKQIVRGAYILHYDFDYLKKTFENTLSKLDEDWRTHPALIDLLVYYIEATASVSQQNDLFGTGIFCKNESKVASEGPPPETLIPSYQLLRDKKILS